MRGSVSAPAPRDRQEDAGLLSDEFGLLFGSQHQVAEALALRRERSEDPPAHAEIRRPHVRAFLRARQAQR